MRLCFYTATFLPDVGGAEIVLDRLATSLVAGGHEVTVLAPRIRGKENRLSRPYRLVRYQRPSSKRFGVRQILLHLFYIKFRYGLDLLHCHGAYPPGFVGAAFKSLTGIPVVIRPHGSDILAGEIIRRNPRLERRMKKALCAADAVIAQSADLESIIIECGARRERVVRIPNGVPISQPRLDLRSPSETPYVFAMGSLTGKKGFDLLIDAFSIIAPQFPDVQLKIAGEGNERAKYEKQIRLLSLEGRVDLLGRVEGEEKERLLVNSLFFVTPSRREPFANVNLEAMAAGKAIVASAVGGNREVVTDGVNGSLFEPLNTKALAQQMAFLLERPDQIQKMGEASRQIVGEYAWEKMVDRYLSLYESLKR